ncbi:putative immune-type receptor 7 precursor, partial [Clarias magur]
MPKVLAKSYQNTFGYDFVEGFNESRFSVTVTDIKFDLNINGIKENDGGEYFCGESEGNIVKFTCGTRLQFEGEEMKLCPTPGTLNSSDEKDVSLNNHQTPTNQTDDEDVLNYAA